MKFNIIHIIICIFVFVGCTQQTVNKIGVFTTDYYSIFYR